MTSMKPKRFFSLINFSLLDLVTALAGTLLFVGSTTTESNSDIQNSNSSSHQHHH